VYPELITIGSFTITTFGLMMALAFLSAYFVVHLELKRQGGDPDLAADLLLGTLIGGILGAKIYYVLLYWDRTALDPVGMLTAREGLVWYGGLIGGTLGAILMLRRRKVGIAYAADLVAPALSIGYAIGRLGCFGVGDDYGRPTDSWVGVKFPQGAPPTTAGNLRRWGAEVDPAVPDAEVLAVHPTQLYESAMALAIFVVLWKLRKRPRAQGSLFALWMVLAGAERLVVEIFRAKDDRFFGPLTLAQVISVALIAGGVYILYRLGRGRPAKAVSG